MSKAGRKPLKTTPRDRFFEKIIFCGDCWIWNGDYNAKNLPLFHARYNGAAISCSARKFSWETEYGNIQDGREVRVSCGNSKCVNPSHLFLNTDENDFWGFVNVGRDDECWNWIGSKDSMGYGSFRGKKSHRVSYGLRFGEFNTRLDVCHKCDNRSCVNPNHLFLGTHQDNMTDMVEKGRSRRGENSGKHKLTLLQATEIKQRILNGEKDSEISKDYSVSNGAIRNIRVGRSWFWI